MTARTVLILAGVMGFFAVALGAFGAHGLRKVTTPDLIEVWETGARYHMYHALALGLVGLLLLRAPNVWMSTAAWCFLAGIALFSGSLYALALSGVRILGAITPFGGFAFLAGWVTFAIGAWKLKG
ncbi:DUF423 domain-containing protein [bacterium]|nr:DUF423 domain-containing protein [bacterium]